MRILEKRTEKADRLSRWRRRAINAFFFWLIERAKNREKTQKVKIRWEQRVKASRSRGVKHCKTAKVQTKRRKHWAPFDGVCVAKDTQYYTFLVALTFAVPTASYPSASLTFNPFLPFSFNPLSRGKKRGPKKQRKGTKGNNYREAKG